MTTIYDPNDCRVCGHPKPGCACDRRAARASAPPTPEPLTHPAQLGAVVEAMVAARASAPGPVAGTPTPGGATARAKAIPPPDDAGAPCDACKGRGWVPSDDVPRAVCAACNGTGYPKSWAADEIARLDAEVAKLRRAPVSSSGETGDAAQDFAALIDALEREVPGKGWDWHHEAYKAARRAVERHAADMWASEWKAHDRAERAEREAAEARARADRAEADMANLRAATQGWGHYEDAMEAMRAARAEADAALEALRPFVAALLSGERTVEDFADDDRFATPAGTVTGAHVKDVARALSTPGGDDRAGSSSPGNDTNTAADGE